MTRRRVIAGIGILVIAVVLGWALMQALARVLQSPNPQQAAVAPTTTPQPQPAAAAIPKIKATLFFGSADGAALVGVEQDVPMAEGVVAQARALVEAQLSATPPPPLTSAVPPGTTLRGVFVSDKNEAFVDLDKVVREKHPGGSMNELFTVYTIVNALTTNLPDIQSVQLMIDGREVDTLAGHVDLRRPLRKNQLLIAKGLEP